MQRTVLREDKLVWRYLWLTFFMGTRLLANCCRVDSTTSYCEDGYRRMARETYEETMFIKKSIEEEIKRIKNFRKSISNLICFDVVDVYEVADELAELADN